MTRHVTVEMSEGTYATLWNAIIKTGDKNSELLFHEVVRMYKTPVCYYTIAKDLLFGFIEEIEKSGDLYHANMILKNCRKEGYYRAHYTFK